MKTAEQLLVKDSKLRVFLREALGERDKLGQKKKQKPDFKKIFVRTALATTIGVGGILFPDWPESSKTEGVETTDAAWILIKQIEFWQAQNSHGDMLHNSSLRPDKDGNWPVSSDGETGSWEGQWGVAPDGLSGWETGLENANNFRLSIDYVGHPDCCMGPLDEPLPDPIRRSSIWFGGKSGFPEIEVAFGDSKAESVIKWNGQVIGKTPKEKNVFHNYIVERRENSISLFLDGAEITNDIDGQPLVRELIVPGGPPKFLAGGQAWSGCEDPNDQKTGADCLYGGWANFHGQATVYQGQPSP